VKVLLSILCATVILFIGGCVMTIGQDGGAIAWTSWAIVGVNLLMITAIWGVTGPLRPLFIGMGGVDAVVAFIIAGATLFNAGNDQEVLRWGLLIAVAFVGKSLLSFLMAGRV
jgi:hypothetical protein